MKVFYPQVTKLKMDTPYTIGIKKQRVFVVTGAGSTLQTVRACVNACIYLHLYTYIYICTIIKISRSS